MVIEYVYLLGLYLGDGNIARSGRTYALSVTLDSRYPGIVDAAASAIREEVVPHRRVRVRRRGGAEIVEAGWNDWPQLFPQHGPGRKHTRRIVLAGWRHVLWSTHTKRRFCGGLIHSDGCRAINRFSVDLPSGRREYAYPRYFFTNMSPDIRGLFAEYCERLGVRCTRSNYKTISVADRRSVALLDSFIGPKS